MKVLIWDFDGVICDTVKECYLITLATIKRESGAIADEAGIRNFFPISFKDFEDYRSKSVNAADFFANYILHQKGMDLNEANLELVTDSHLPFLKRMDEVFYEEREKLMHGNKGEYFKTLNPYPQIPETLESLTKNGIKHVIMSARDELSIRQILAHFSLDHYFEFIIGHEVDKGNRHVKGQQIKILKQKIRKKYPLETEFDLYFIDDIPFNLKKVLGEAKLLFAQWGYGKMRKGYAGAATIESPKSLSNHFK